MNDPWFNPMYWAWLPGTALGCAAGIWGALVGILAPRGKAKGLILGCGLALMVIGLGCLVAAVVAWFSGQPYGVWYGLGLPGLLLPAILAPLLPVALARYREAEARRMQAHDLT